MKRMGLFVLLVVWLVIAGCTEEGESRNVSVSPTLSPSATETMPTASPATAATMETGEPGAFKKETTDSGFRLLIEEPKNARQIFATTIEDGTSYGVHVLTTEEPKAGESMYGRMVVVVQPDSGEYRSYPLYRVKVDDTYAPDSIAVAYGMLDSRHLLYISAKNEDGDSMAYRYSVESLDITTGEKTVLVPVIEGLETLPEGEHFARCWLTKSKKKLVLNSYTEGKVWTIDIASGEVRQLPIQAKHHWPFYSTAVSPDGELFWYMDSENSRFVLMDIEGRERSASPFPSERIREQSGWFYWSPNGKYAMFDDSSTAEQNPVIVEDSDFAVKAMSQLTFYDREGNGRSIAFDRSEGQYVEVVGWLGDDDEYAVLRFYDLEGARSSQMSRNISFMLFNVATGGMALLEQASDMQGLANAEAPRLYKSRPGTREPLLLVDRENRTFALLSDEGAWVKPLPEDRSAWAWVHADHSDGSPVLQWTESGSTELIREAPILTNRYDEAGFVSGNWIAFRDMTYIKVD